MGSPTQMPAILVPSVASRVSRPPPAACAARTVSSSPAANEAPASHRPAASPNSSAESMGAAASAMSKVRSVSALRAAGQSVSRPLWLNSQRCSVNGAAQDSSGPNPGVAERTAARMQPLDTVGAREPNDASLQIGWARR